jgi:hypothetical protein
MVDGEDSIELVYLLVRSVIEGLECSKTCMVVRPIRCLGHTPAALALNMFSRSTPE